MGITVSEESIFITAFYLAKKGMSDLEKNLFSMGG